jgi:dephospho-CoA kinase
MIRLAVVGDIGSGKSYVGRQFGYPVFNADNEVAEIYKKSRKFYKKIKRLFPSHRITFPVEKKIISKVIQENPNNIKKIAKIIHPEIRYKMHEFIIKNKGKKYVMLDIPLLLENKLNKKKDILIFIYAQKKEINKRLRKRKNYNPKIFNILKKFQLPVEIKRKKSNFIIKNNFKSDSIKKSVKNLIKKFN